MAWLATKLSNRAAALLGALALVWAIGCGGDDAPTGTSVSDDSSTSVSETSGATTSSPSSSGTTSTDPTDTTGGEHEYCGIMDTGDGPWFTVRHRGKDLEHADALQLECGPQGSFMFEFYVRIGGFVPSTDTVPFAVTMNVDGFDVGPGDAFYTTQNYSVYVGCEESVGGLPSLNMIRIFPPDEIADLAELDGAAVTLRFEMKAAGEELPFEITGTLAAAEDETWGCCFDFELCF